MAVKTSRTQNGKAHDPAADAREWLAGIEERKGAGRFLIQPPAALPTLNKPISCTPGCTCKVEARPCGERTELLRKVTNWMKATGEMGGAADLRRAWGAWNPFDVELRHAMRGLYDELLQKCTVREITRTNLVVAADAIIAGKRAGVMRIEKAPAAVAEAEKTLAAKQAELATLEAAARP